MTHETASVDRLLRFTLGRLQAFDAEIERLSRSEFPYPHSQQALAVLKLHFDGYRQSLAGFTSAHDPRIVARKCREVLEQFGYCLPLLGFVLRSTNVRNAFEVFAPFLSLCGAVLEPDVQVEERRTRLLLSSEWEFSPFVYPEIPHLPDFVLIGFPAPESANPLLLPLGAHELGHALWVKRKFGDRCRPMIQKAVLAALVPRLRDYCRVSRYSGDVEGALSDLFVLDTLVAPMDWALKQVEETFCDLVGLAVFEAGYLAAFAYLLAPGFGGRTPYYPSLQSRVNRLASRAMTAGITVPSPFTELFVSTGTDRFGEFDSFRLVLADEAVESLFGEICRWVDEDPGLRLLPRPSAEEQRRIQSDFLRHRPSEGCRTLADIVNAGWLATLGRPRDSDADALVRELVLKTFEVYEIEALRSR